MPTAVAYARYSSDRQHESSIEAQQQAIERYASAHGITIVELYADRAKSGTSDKRPEFLRLLDDLRRRPVDLVLVHKLDRFARNRYHAAIYSRLIKERGSRLIAVAQDFGDGPEAVIMEALMQGMAEYYSLNLATEVIKGRKIKIGKAEHPGGTYPFGYRPDGHGGYIVDEVEAYYLRRLAQAALDGKPSYAEIIREMQAVGVRGRRGKSLSPGNVSTMLKNPIYAGIYLARAGDQQIRIDNHHPAIFEKAYQEEVIRVLASKKNVGRSAAGHRKYPCSGLTFCAACGSPMYGHMQKKNGFEYAYYTCYKSCGGVRMIPADELEQAACDYVKALLSADVRAKLAGAFSAYIVHRRDEQQRAEQENKSAIAKLESQIESLMGNLSAGVLPPAVVKRIGEQITQCEEQISALKEAAAPLPDFTDVQIDDYFANAATVSPSDDYARIRSTFTQFISRIVIHPTCMEFHSTFDDWLRKRYPGLLPDRYTAPLPPEFSETPAPASRSNSKNKRLRWSAMASFPAADAASPTIKPPKTRTRSPICRLPLRAAAPQRPKAPSAT